MRAITVDANFSYESVFGSRGPTAYEILLLDSMRGDATLFTRRDEVEAEWRIITPIEEAWKRLPAPNFPNYAAGSEGPAEADALIRGDHRQWRDLGG
jgi:glucose-6-phosphate 1-dehydrogenase